MRLLINRSIVCQSLLRCPLITSFSSKGHNTIFAGKGSKLSQDPRMAS